MITGRLAWTVVLSGLVVTGLNVSVVFAADRMANLPNPTTPNAPTIASYALLGWAPSVGIVEQLQAIHRLSQNPSEQAVLSLISALESPYPLARRKAAASLLQRSAQADETQRHTWVTPMTPALSDTDPVVRGYAVRMIANLHSPEANSCLKSFFHRADKAVQQSALDALVQADSLTPDLIALIRQSSPFGEIRQAVDARP